MSTVISKDGTRIAYEVCGSGPALLLVDGALCCRSFGPMQPLSSRLEPHFSVYTFDRRGRGESGDTKPYAIEREVEDIEALLDEAGGSAYLYGVSSGAVLALRASCKLSGVKKLAMYEPPFLVDSSHRIPDDYFEQFEVLLAENRRGDLLEHFMVKGVGMPVEALEPVRNSPVWPLLESVAPTLVYDTMIMGDYSLSGEIRDLLHSVPVPALVMGGGASPAHLQSAARAVAGSIPGALLVILDGQTHDAEPQAVAPRLREYFK